MFDIQRDGKQQRRKGAKDKRRHLQSCAWQQVPLIAGLHVHDEGIQRHSSHSASLPTSTISRHESSSNQRRRRRRRRRLSNNCIYEGVSIITASAIIYALFVGFYFVYKINVFCWKSKCCKAIPFTRIRQVYTHTRTHYSLFVSCTFYMVITVTCLYSYYSDPCNWVCFTHKTTTRPQIRTTNGVRRLTTVGAVVHRGIRFCSACHFVVLSVSSLCRVFHQTSFAFVIIAYITISNAQFQ